MSIYISRIDIVELGMSRFVNLRPLLEVQPDGMMNKVGSDEFQPYGTITIQGGHNYRGSNAQYLEEGAYFQVTLSDEDIQEAKNNADPKTGRLRIYVMEYFKRCQLLTTLPISEVIHLPKQYSIKKYNEWKDEYLHDLLSPLLKSVYLEDAECIAGPFTWNQSQDDRYNFVIDNQNNLNQDKYSIPCYEKQAFNKILQYLEARNTYQQMRQVFNPQNLPEKIDTIDCIDDDKLKKLVIDYLSHNAADNINLSTIEEIIESLPSESFSEYRRERILGLLQNRHYLGEIINHIPPLLLGEEEHMEALVSSICGNVDYLNTLLPKIKEHEKYRDEIDKLEAKIQDKKMTLSDLENQIGGFVQISSEKVEEFENILQEKDDKLAKMEAELAKKEKELTRKDEEIAQYRKVEDIEKKYEEEKAALDKLENRKKDLYSVIANLSTDIKQNVTDAYANLAIDGAISSMMIHEAAEFERRENQKKIQETVSTLENVEKKSSIKTASELVEFLYAELTSVNRNLSKNDIANILICVSQGFLTVFAGEPGCGKTSLVSLLAQILGLSNTIHTRYQEIAVEKGWTSRRDLIGYYNPLTKSFEAANKGMFSALATSEAESKLNISAFPYWILLDEANLSQMEHYWADFMGICDLDKSVRQVSLNEDYVFRINPTLRFLATINLDHTTEVLSPRLIDRAWIIKLKAAELDIGKPLSSKLDREYEMVEFAVFEQLSSPEYLATQKLDSAIVDRFNDIHRIFVNEVGIDFSPRVIDMIRRYCLASKNLIDTSKNSYAALDYAIAQKILPMIDGYGQKYQNLVEELLKICNYNSMPVCNRLLLDIRKKAESNMQYYQFFAR